MDSIILKALHSFTKKRNSHSHVVRLKGDASNREYYRDQTNNLILCHYHTDQDGFNHFINLQKILKKSSINVPEILYSKFPVLIQEDLGNRSLEMNPSPKNYSKALDILIGWQSLPTKFDFKKSEVAFTKEKFLWELNFAVEHLNQLILPTQNKFDLNKFNLKENFNSLCDFILQTPQCPCHRDFHSKNLMIKEDHELYVIDFQDARLGPFLYDLASLLEDPYVELTKSEKNSLKSQFLKLSAIKYNQDFEELYRTVAIQRLFKACGSFASQYNLKNNNKYLSYLEPAFSNINELLDGTNYGTNYSNFKNFIGLNSELWKSKQQETKMKRN